MVEFGFSFFEVHGIGMLFYATEAGQAVLGMAKK